MDKEITSVKRATITEDLARFIVSLSFQDLPKPVIDKVKLCILHAFACSFAGYHLPWSQTAINFLKDLNVKGIASTIVDGLKAPPPEVSFVNSVLGHSIIQEDMHAGSMSHPGTIVIPAALATGEEMNSTGKGLIVAITLGYEVMGRIGASVASTEFAKTFRPSGFFGPYGACAAAAKLFKLTEEQTVNALGIASNLSLGFNQWAIEGTDDVYYHNGFASSNGIRAVMLGRAGAVASKSIVEGPSGFWAAYGKQGPAENVTKGLGESYEILKAYFKLAPACAFVQTADALALEMVKSHAIDPEKIDKIEIQTFQVAKEYPGVDYTGPFTSSMQAKLSLPYGVAAVLVFKELNQSIYDRFNDSVVNKIAAKCRVESDSELSKIYPQKQGSEINIYLQDNAVISGKHDNASIMSEDQVVENFRYQAGRFLDAEKVQKLIDSIFNLEKVEEVRDLTNLYIVEK